ncbi:hypothetical protein SEVIR_4G171326v4 [Setaria viridis]
MRERGALSTVRDSASHPDACRSHQAPQPLSELSSRAPGSCARSLAGGQRPWHPIARCVLWELTARGNVARLPQRGVHGGMVDGDVEGHRRR